MSTSSLFYFLSLILALVSIVYLAKGEFGYKETRAKNLRISVIILFVAFLGMVFSRMIVGEILQ